MCSGVTLASRSRWPMIVLSIASDRTFFESLTKSNGMQSIDHGAMYKGSEEITIAAVDVSLPNDVQLA